MILRRILPVAQVIKNKAFGLSWIFFFRRLSLAGFLFATFLFFAAAFFFLAIKTTLFRFEFLRISQSCNSLLFYLSRVGALRNSCKVFFQKVKKKRILQVVALIPKGQKL